MKRGGIPCGVLFLLIVGTIVSLFARFSPWMLRKNGPELFYDGNSLTTKAISYNYGFFYVQLCEDASNYCYTQTMPGRRDDLNQFYSKAVVDGDLWYVRKLGAIVVSSLATVFNIIGVLCVLLSCIYGLRRSGLVLELLTATFVLTAAILQWYNVGLVFAELGAYLRFPVTGVTTHFPISLFFSTVGAFVLTVCAIWYYADIFLLMRNFGLRKEPYPTKKKLSRRYLREHDKVYENGAHQNGRMPPPPPSPEPMFVVPQRLVPVPRYPMVGYYRPPPPPPPPAYMHGTYPRWTPAGGQYYWPEKYDLYRKHGRRPSF